MGTAADDSFNNAYVSDIAASHLETLFKDGTATLGALTDLLEFSQAALMHEQVMLSPQAYKNSSFVRAFPWVKAPELKIVEADADPPESEAESASKPAIVVDADADGLFGHDPSAEMLLAMAFSEMMQDNPALGFMINPEQMDPTRDRGLFYRSKLPVMMFLLQVRRGLIQFDSDATHNDLMQVLDPALDGYRMIARHLCKIQYTWNVGVVSSVIEQPLLSAFLVDEATEPYEDTPDARNLIQHFSQAALGARGRARFFDKWRFPPLGLLALAEARSLDDVAKQVTEARDKFARVRESVTRHARRRAQLLSEAEGFSSAADKAAAELDRLDAELREAYESFDVEVQLRRKRFKRTEVIFNTLGYALTVAAGWGLGTIGAVVEKLGLKRRAVLQRVPGLFKAASFITGRDLASAPGIIEKLLGHPSASFENEARLMALAFEHATAYSETRLDAVPAEMDVLIDKNRHGTDRTFWSGILKGDA